jgi:hypothetical protein
MIAAYIILGVAVGLPLVLGIIFRVNTAYLFFSLLAGELLSRYFGEDAELVLRMVAHGDVVRSYAPLIVMLLPVIFTALFLRRTLSKTKLVFQFIPFLVTGVVLAAFALPLLPESLRQQVQTVQVGRQLLDSTHTVVGAVVALQLVTLWITNRPRGEHGKGKHH